MAVKKDKYGYEVPDHIRLDEQVGGLHFCWRHHKSCYMTVGNRGHTREECRCDWCDSVEDLKKAEKKKEEGKKKKKR